MLGAGPDRVQHLKRTCEAPSFAVRMPARPQPDPSSSTRRPRTSSGDRSRSSAKPWADAQTCAHSSDSQICAVRDASHFSEEGENSLHPDEASTQPLKDAAVVAAEDACQQLCCYCC